MQKYSKIIIMQNLNNEKKIYILVYQFTCHLQMIILNTSTQVIESVQLTSIPLQRKRRKWY